MSVEAMMDLFGGLDRAHGTYRVTGTKDGKAVGKAVTIQKPVTEQIWQAHLAGETGIGIVPITDSGTVVFGAIDIDDYDLDFDAMENRAKELGLPVVLCRTKSGGLHLYVFLEKPTPAVHVRAALHSWAAALGYPKAEVFPKQDSLASKEDVGNWINMPYFDAERTMRYAIEDGKSLSLAQFIELAYKRRTAVVKPVKAPPAKPVEGPLVDGAPPCLQALAKDGVPQGTRNNAMYSFGVLANKATDSREEMYSMMVVYNNSYMDPPLPASEVMDIGKSIRRKDYFYKCKDEPLRSVCDKRACSQCEYGLSEVQAMDGVTVEGLTKINTDPPTWIVQLDGQRVTVTTEEMYSQAKFHVRCMEVMHKMPKRVGTKSWLEFLSGLLATVRVVEVPPDSSPSGLFLDYLMQFCTTRAPAAKRDEILAGKPWHDEDGRTYFRVQDFIEYLDNCKFRLVQGHQIYATLRQVVPEVDHKKMTLMGKTVTVWSVPQFVGQEFGFESADLPEEEF